MDWEKDWSLLMHSSGTPFEVLWGWGWLREVPWYTEAKWWLLDVRGRFIHRLRWRQSGLLEVLHVIRHRWRPHRCRMRSRIGHGLQWHSSSRGHQQHRQAKPTSSPVLRPEQRAFKGRYVSFKNFETWRIQDGAQKVATLCALPECNLLLLHYHCCTLVHGYDCAYV